MGNTNIPHVEWVRTSFTYRTTVMNWYLTDLKNPFPRTATWPIPISQCKQPGCKRFNQQLTGTVEEQTTQTATTL